MKSMFLSLNSEAQIKIFLNEEKKIEHSYMCLYRNMSITCSLVGKKVYFGTIYIK